MPDWMKTAATNAVVTISKNAKLPAEGRPENGALTLSRLASGSCAKVAKAARVTYGIVAAAAG